MTTAIATIDQEKLSHLAEEIKSIVSTSRDNVTIEMIAAKYMIGETIVASELYKKHAKSQSSLYEAIEELTRMRPATLSECAKLYETYPDKKPKQIADRLYTEHGAWRNVRLALYGDVSDASETSQKRSECKHCPIHCHD